MQHCLPGPPAYDAQDEPVAEARQHFPVISPDRFQVGVVGKLRAVPVASFGGDNLFLELVYDHIDKLH
jgi:hypothetical protein